MAAGLVSLLVIRAVMGLAEGPVASTGVAVAVEASHPKRRGMNNGIFQCMISLFGNAIGPIIATQLLLVTSWRTVFMLVGIPGLIMAAAMFFLVREPVADSAGGARVDAPGFADLFSHRNVPLAMLTLMCAMGGIFVMGAMMPNYLTDYLHLSVAADGLRHLGDRLRRRIGQFAMPTVSDFIGRKLATLAVLYPRGGVHLPVHPRGGGQPDRAVLADLLRRAVQLLGARHSRRAGRGRSRAAGHGRLGRRAGHRRGRDLRRRRGAGHRRPHRRARAASSTSSPSLSAA